MNTPKTPKRNKLRDPSEYTSLGGFSIPIHQNYAMALGWVSAMYGSVEEAMIGVFRVLLGIDNRDFGPLAFYAIKSPRARIDLMRRVLERAQDHVATNPRYDEILTRFGTLTSRRNEYIHSIWRMGADDMGYYFPTDGDPEGPFMGKPIKASEVGGLADELQALLVDIIQLTSADLMALHERYVKRVQLTPEHPAANHKPDAPAKP